MTQGMPIPHRAGLYLGLLQLLLTLGWTSYAVYLPRLAAQVGLAASAVIWLLMLDQVIFSVTDFVSGVAADRLAGRVGRVSRVVVAVTALSCAAFVALPWVAGTGALPLFLGLTVLWAATSSVLRAPTLKLLSKYAPRPQIPWLAGLVALGFGLAGAVAPYVAATLRGMDPRWPFVLSSAALLLACFGLERMERGLATKSAETKPAAKPEAADPVPPASRVMLFLAAAVILALGFQVHSNINSGPFFRRFAEPADIELLMPVFWIGFSLAVLPAGWLAARWGRLAVGGAAGLVGAAAVLAAHMAGSLTVMIAAQFVAGAAWGCMVTSLVAAAPVIGGKGHEGFVLGLTFSALALATLARMSAVAGGLPADPAYAAVLGWAPALAWSAGGAALLVLAAMARPHRETAAA